MLKNELKILIYAIGNPGRQDDGLGIALADRIESKFSGKFEFDSNYQLNVEDALLISEKDIVLFIDASKNEIEDYQLSRIKPQGSIEFTTHSMAPSSVLALCEELYNKTPLALMMEIKGYEWEINETISDRALVNLDKAEEFLNGILQEPSAETLLENCVSE